MLADRESRSPQRDGEASDPMADHKRRARWRLLGAFIITGVVAGIAPFLLEEQARPLSQDLLVEIPSRNSLFSRIDSLKPAPVVTSAEPVEPKQSEPQPKAPPVQAQQAQPSPEPVAAKKSEPVAKASPEPKKAAPKSEPKVEATKTEIAKTEAKKADSKKSADGGFLVQVGVFSKIENANAARAKLTSGGHRVIVEAIKSEDGSERHRVRIGPFETRELANQVRDRAKSQGYEAMVVGP